MIISQLKRLPLDLFLKLLQCGISFLTNCVESFQPGIPTVVSKLPGVFQGAKPEPSIDIDYLLSGSDCCVLESVNLVEINGYKSSVRSRSANGTKSLTPLLTYLNNQLGEETNSMST